MISWYNVLMKRKVLILFLSLVLPVVSSCDFGNTNKPVLTLVSDNYEIYIGNSVNLSCTVSEGDLSNIVYSYPANIGIVSLEGNIVTGLKVGIARLSASIGSLISNTITITVLDPLADPYKNMEREEFYATYTPARSYLDSQYRSLHSFMSGSLEVNDQVPVISSYIPMDSARFVKNSSYIFGNEGNSYTLLDSNGNPSKTIYRGGGYTNLDEVAAHVFAFNEIPGNHIASNRSDPSNSRWGEYLRLNHTQFYKWDADTRYPYQPIIPGIKSPPNNGSIMYYEMDIGTTGTDCDPGYPCEIYNDGEIITRGAARIVYSQYDEDKSGDIEMDERHLFYTYNHYNDFQEFLNYEGGWGKMFGNVTGGGALNQMNNPTPTQYPEVAHVLF